MPEETNTIDNLKKYQWAAVAATLPGERKVYSLPAMGKLYDSFGVSNDPIIARALSEASVGANGGNITNAGVVQAIGLYSNKFDEAYNETKVGDFISYVEDTGYSLPDEVADLLTVHSGVKISELDKENDSQKKVLVAMQLLRQQVLEGNLYSSLVKETTTSNLESLVDSE